MSVTIYDTSGRPIFTSESADTQRAAVLDAVSKRADLRSADLGSANLGFANLGSANLRSADLRSADLRSANLGSANLGSADLRSADLGFANLGSADLRSANLGSADLRSADLRSADLRSANLGFANLGFALKVLRSVGVADRSDGYQFRGFELEDHTLGVRAGCRTFTLVEFRAHVAREYPDTAKAVETLRILSFLRASLKQERW